VTTVQRTIVIVLAVLSALCEIAGTVTVLMTYQRTAKLGLSIRGVITSRRELDEQRRSDPYQADWDKRKGTISPGDFRDSMSEYQGFLDALAEPLQPSPLARMGLIAYIAGALFGLAAAVVAVVA
jgi:hypothetical protein